MRAACHSSSAALTDAPSRSGLAGHLLPNGGLPPRHRCPHPTGRLGRRHPSAKGRDPLLQSIRREIAKTLSQHALLFSHRPPCVLAGLVQTLRVRDVRGARGPEQITQLTFGRLKLRGGQVARRSDDDRERRHVGQRELEQLIHAAFQPGASGQRHLQPVDDAD